MIKFLGKLSSAIGESYKSVTVSLSIGNTILTVSSQNTEELEKVRAFILESGIRAHSNVPEARH